MKYAVNIDQLVHFENLETFKGTKGEEEVKVRHWVMAQR